jgi:catechol 2,3-dioxygenase-like lactoylglutathione lyase family enzyme
MIRINIASIFVTDQAKAREFYTKVLGFEVRNDVDMGDGNYWLTVGTPGEPAVELLLEPSGHPAVGPFRDALLADGIPSTSFAVDDVQAEYERLVARGVEFTQPPTAMGPVTAAVLDDTVGNLIMLAQMN